MENNYKVYIHIFPNKKVYIGITRQKVEYRWNNGKKYDNNIYMTNAIQKYGWDNIEHKVLYENLTKEEAEQKEIELIKQYKSNIREFGYNILKGGNASNGLSEEIWKRISEKSKGKHYSPNTEFKKGNKPWNTGKKMSKELRQKLSEAHKGKKLSEETKRKLSKISSEKLKGRKVSEETRKKISIAMKGKNHTEETKIKISNAKKGTISQNKKKVICIEKNIVYNSLTEASLENNISISKISNCCNEKRKTTGGYHFKFYD